MTSYPNAYVLYTPAQTPTVDYFFDYIQLLRFSPIENKFGYTKNKLKDFMFTRKEELTMKVMSLMFSYKKARIMSFYRKTLSNMVEFWTKLDRNGLFQ